MAFNQPKEEAAKESSRNVYFPFETDPKLCLTIIDNYIKYPRE